MAITGYTSSTSVRPGETLDLYLSSDTPGPVTLSVSRYDYGTPIPLQLQVTLQTQAVPGPARESLGQPGGRGALFRRPPCLARA